MTENQGKRAAEESGEPILRWETPPPVRKHSNPAMLRVIEGLMSRPGEWAKVEDNRKWHTAVNAWARAGCETAARSNGVGGYSIYARWPVPKTKFQAEREQERRQEIVRARQVARVNRQMGREMR